MEEKYTPNISFSPYNHDPSSIVLPEVHGYVVHAMSEYINRSGLVYYKGYNKDNATYNNKPLEDYPEWIPCDYWLYLIGYSCTSFILPDGTLKICQETNHKAYHAGVSKWNQFKNLNSFFIGSEVILEGKNNYGEFLDRINNENWVTEEQYKTTAWEIALTMNKYHYDKENIVGHNEVSGDEIRGKGRGKQDPGNAFDWDKLFYYITKIENTI